MDEVTNTQYAPFPNELQDIIDVFKYKPGWGFHLQTFNRGQLCGGLTLTISVTTPNSYNYDDEIVVRHLFPVPPAAYNKGSWRRWLFDRIGDVDTHERMEFFEIDGVKPYAPHHGPGEDPYIVWERGTDEAARMNNRGVVK